MAPDYQYLPLNNPATDIRLVVLLPGQEQDELKVYLTQTSLPSTPDNLSPSLGLIAAQLTTTLPPGWKARETRDDRILFVHESDDDPPVLSVTWDHPDPGPDFDPSLLLPRKNNDHEPAYEALSYSWGGTEKQCEITVVSVDAASLTTSHQASETWSLPVTRDLKSALQYLRRSDSTRTLWIDAICINQADLAERNCQVRRMDDIYRLAHRVVVWLGDTADDSDQALHSLGRVGRHIVSTKSGLIRVFPKREDSDDLESHGIGEIMPRGDDIWAAIEALFQRPWFRRLWVMQEIQLASYESIVQVGVNTISWPLFNRALSVVNLTASAVYLPPTLTWTLLFAGAEFLSRSYRDVPFANLVSYARFKYCEDPRDKVYGILGLAAAGLKAKIPIQYQLPPAQVWQSMVLALSDFVGRLEILTLCCSTLRKSAFQVPSWVPELCAERWPGTYRWGQFAAGYSRCQISFRAPGTLDVTGVSVGDKIAKTYGPGQDDDMFGALDTIREWFKGLGDVDTAVYSPTGQPLLEAYAKALRVGRLRDRFPDGPFWTLTQWIDRLRKILFDIDPRPAAPDSPSSGSGSSLNSRSDSPDSRLDNLRDLIPSEAISFSAERTLVITEKGYIGLAPPGAQIGDNICVLLGCDSPIILRPTAPGVYTVIGQAFIYGLADATAILGPLPHPWVSQVFDDWTGILRRMTFLNTTTGERIQDDPRLEPLENWEFTDKRWEHGDPDICQKFRNLTTGEIVNYDPRLLPEALKKRGIPLQIFSLV